jgi:hypothetical protein
MNPDTLKTASARTVALGTAVGLLLVASVLAPRLSGCQDTATARSNARQIATRTDLIGGPSALGEVGDYLLENDQIRVIIQDKGFSRGFGVYGGSLIDADLVRPVANGTVAGGQGRDQFGELFPIFFLEAMVPEAVEVLSDGSDGSPARVRVRGNGGDFLTLTKVLNQVILNSHEFTPELFAPDFSADTLSNNPKIEFEVVYSLAPGDRHVTIESTLRNLTSAPLAVPSPEAQGILQLLLGLSAFDVPLGHVLLFGAGNKAFAPGQGYNIRYALEDGYAAGSELPFPALPGLITPGMFTTSKNGISYGFKALGDTPNFAQNRLRCDDDGENCVNLYEEAYGEPVADDALLVPFLASAFTGVFYAQTPRSLGASCTEDAQCGEGACTESECTYGACGEECADGQVCRDDVCVAPREFTFTSLFFVGDGDVGSVMDAAYAVAGQSTQQLSGVVRDQVTLAPVSGASVIIYDESGGAINQFYTSATGQFTGRMPAGQYTARVERDPTVSVHVPFTLGSGGAYLELSSPSAAVLSVTVYDEAGRLTPAKVSVVGIAPTIHAGEESRSYLFDLEAGQRWRASDSITDDPQDPEGTMQYLETLGYTRGGKLELLVRPGRYKVFASRGLEYDAQVTDGEIEATAGQRVPLVFTLVRTVDTTGYIGADFHLHSAPSLDSSLSIEERLHSCAGEGLELAVATDHNFVTDFRPTLEREGLSDFMSSMVGLELTTLESGHFNGFPIRRDAAHVTRGSFEWSLRTPDEVFTDLRALGKFGPKDTIIQVNHARNSILGYFAQYDLDPLSATITPPEGSSLISNPGALASVNGPAFRRFRTDDGAECEPGDEAPDDCRLRNTFSFDFDAMEVFNGKRLEQVRSFQRPNRIPDSIEIAPEAREALSAIAPGTVLCDADYDENTGLFTGTGVAFPGMVDDWFNLLNQDKRIAGLGNSDAHGAYLDECGFPRTYVGIGSDDPTRIDDRAVVNSVQRGRLIVTNGPFVQLHINGHAIGGDPVTAGDSVEVVIDIQAAPWVHVDKARLIRNAVVIDEWDVALEDGRALIEKTYEIAEDGWYVVEVSGRASMFPIVTPVEQPPVLLTDAVGALAGAFGFGASGLGDLRPEEVHITTPYAITNPIWVDAGGDGYEQPVPAARICEGFAVEDALVPDGAGKPAASTQNKLSPQRTILRRNMVPSLWFPRERNNTHDIRMLFDQFAHGHHHAN